RQTTRIVSVLAADERSGLALLRTAQPLENTVVLQPEPGAGALQLGRNVMLQTLTEQYAGSVNSPAIQDELGAYRYAIKTMRATRGDAAAIIDPQTNRLLGMIERGNSGLQSAAVESEAINDLLRQKESVPSKTLEEFGNFYYNETTTGRLAVMEQYVSSEQFLSAIRYGKSIRNLDSYTQKNTDPLLEGAFVGAARDASGQRQWRQVIALVSDAEQTLPLTDDLLLMRAEAYQSTGQLDAALDDLIALQNPDTKRVRVMVVENALAGGQQSATTSMSLLERALAADPDYAPYHRLRGETLARQGNLIDALGALEKAVALDPGMQQELQPLISRLRARRNTPPLTEVPIQRRRSTLYVDARVNGSSETFRFLFDTGASYTAITSETALRLGINNIFFGAPVVRLQTANGQVYTTTATLSSIDVAGARVDNVEAVILESMNGVDGLLGQSFLRHFDVNIDRTRGVIAFNRRLDE
ncbi:MAG: TIGR02281 family clan AA aspartic protease, partial [Gammaproteobacteria bacterium]|nr:TIGR02281 family clan AA aspartic protease [Gammaproteobacteria bacterium]